MNTSIDIWLNNFQDFFNGAYFLLAKANQIIYWTNLEHKELRQ